MKKRFIVVKDELELRKRNCSNEFYYADEIKRYESNEQERYDVLSTYQEIFDDLDSAKKFMYEEGLYFKEKYKTIEIEALYLFEKTLDEESEEIDCELIDCRYADFQKTISVDDYYLWGAAKENFNLLEDFEIEKLDENLNKKFPNGDGLDYEKINTILLDVDQLCELAEISKDEYLARV